MIIILLGLPGSGKGTQAKMISEKFKIPNISTGDIFRKTLESDSPVSEEIRKIVNSGLLVPDNIVSDIVQKRLDEKDTEFGFILDGFPRNINQAEIFRNYLLSRKKKIDLVIFFDLPPEISIKRLTARRHCPKCMRNYNLLTQPPINDEVCDVCGVKIEQRTDDKIETTRRRVEVYEKETSPLVEYYSNKKLLKRVKADKPVEEVFQNVVQLLKNGNYIRAN